MYEDAAAQAVKDLLNTNKATLVTGISHGGQPRQIKHIAKTALAPPLEYYSIAVIVTDARQYAGRANAQLANPPDVAEYDIVIRLNSMAQVDFAEDEPFEQENADFNLLGDRIVKLIRDNTTLTGAAGQKYHLKRAGSAESDRAVRKSNHVFYWGEAEEMQPELYTEIIFTIIDRCVDDSLLYP